MDRIKIGVLGVGHLGSIHLKNLKEISEFEVAGINDIDTDKAQSLSSEYSVPYFKKYEDLIDNVDCVSIVVPTIDHYKLAKHALLNKKHVFIEKPVTTTVPEAEELIKIARNNNLKLQVGHIERFNPAFRILQNLNLKPMFIESHRLASFVPRGIDVSVILDIMIHDIDIILNLIPSEIEDIQAAGVQVITDKIDIANARIKFKNQAVANVTASRISQKKMRKMRLFQKSNYIAIDFLEKYSEIFELIENDDNGKGTGGIVISSFDHFGKNKKILYSKDKSTEENALKAELQSFAHCIKNNTEPEVTGEDGKRALDVALQILEKIGMEES